MRIVAGAWRGRSIAAPPSDATRPTADRVRQALFDMLSHAPWAPSWDQCRVLDAFAGSGALGLEALSRGAAEAFFFETDRRAMLCLRANIAALGAKAEARACDATRPPRSSQGACSLIFLDPPYGQDLVPKAARALREAGWLATGSLVVAETARSEPLPVEVETLLAERSHGVARLSIWRAR